MRSFDKGSTMSDSKPDFRTYKQFVLEQAKESQFDVEIGDFSHLEIRKHDERFYYFFDAHANRLIKNFVLREGLKVDTLCNVVLIRGDDGTYSPRVKVWKKDKTAVGGTIGTEEVSGDDTVLVKAAVDLGDVHENFWKLIDFLQSFKDIALPLHRFRVTNDVELLDALRGHDKPAVLGAVKAYLGSDVTEADVQMLVDRRQALALFERMLNDPNFVEQERRRLGNKGPEGVWQQFFEDNQWIFGYGLKLVACKAYSDEKLEQTTTGANLFTGGGKRIDAAMRTRGFIQSLVFTEIKTPLTDLLVPEPYRAPDVYQPAKELSGAVSQVQKTTHKAVKKLEDLHRQHTREGAFEFEVSTIRPRQVVVAGHLSQLVDRDVPNVEKMTSFELFRRDQHDVEILTFDELYARARFIVESQEPAPVVVEQTAGPFAERRRHSRNFDF